MVPVFYDVQRRKTKVWALLGWANRPATLSFATRPAIRVKDLAGNPADSEVDLQFWDSHPDLAFPVFAELYVNRLLNRDEFREHCDKHRTQEAILANL